MVGCGDAGRTGVATYNSKGCGQDERHSDHVNGLVDSIVMERGVLRRVSDRSDESDSGSRAGGRDGGAYKNEVSLQVKRHFGKWSRERRAVGRFGTGA